MIRIVTAVTIFFLLCNSIVCHKGIANEIATLEKKGIGTHNNIMISITTERLL